MPAPSRRLVFSGIGMISAVCLLAIAWQTQGADPEETADLSLQSFMRKKLDASMLILEGLTVEDAGLIQRGAASLLKMSNAEMWKVVIDKDFRQHNIEFRATVKKLQDAADKGNFDNVALQWFDTTKSCIECHKDVRGERKK